MKRKHVEVGGRAFVLAPLTVSQVERLLDAEAPLSERAWQPILDSLVNAGERVDVPQLKELLDHDDFQQLHQTVLAFNELRAGRDVEAPPEATASEPLDFSHLRARLAAHCGWTFYEADEQPFVEVLRLCDYWAEESPPVDRLFAHWVGFKPRRHMGTHGGSSSREEIAAFTGQWGGQIRRGADNLPTFMQAALAKEGILNFGRPKDPGPEQSQS